MAKTPRPSIADQLAGIAATRPPDHVTTLQRDEATIPSRENDGTEAAPVTETSPRTSLSQPSTTRPRGNVTTRKRGDVTAEGLKIRQRIEKPHVSLYAHPRVLKKLREIAVAEDCKPHDLYIEGLRLVLARYGFDLDKIERGEPS